jgi:hypothetical protein
MGESSRITHQGILIDRSGTISSGGNAQQLAAANPNRRYFLIQNASATTLALAGISSTESLFFNFAANANTGEPSIELVPNQGFVMETGFINIALVSVIAATTGHPFTAKEL